MAAGPWAPSQEQHLQSRSSRPCRSASERCCCLLITLIIENYRFSVGNVYLHPTFPKLPISIAVMSHPPVRFRQRWPLRLRTACCCRTGRWPGDRRLPPGTVLDRALHMQQCPRGWHSHQSGARAPYPSWVPAAGVGSACPVAQESRGRRWCHPMHGRWLTVLGRGGHPGQPCQGAALPSSALCSRPSRSWLTRGCFIAREPSGRGSLPGDGRGFLQRDFCARCFPSLLAQCLWAARASGAPSWSVGFKEALPVLVTLWGGLMGWLVPAVGACPGPAQGCVSRASPCTRQLPQRGASPASHQRGRPVSEVLLGQAVFPCLCAPAMTPRSFGTRPPGRAGARADAQV